MKTLFILLALLLTPVSGFAEIYKWIDNNGTVHFSDQPQPGATIINIPSAEQTAANNTAQNTTVLSPAAGNNAPAASQKQTYQSLSILNPQDKGSIFDNTGTVNIEVEIKPALAADDKFQVLLDGQAFGAAQTELPLRISGVERGEHQIAVALQDKDGKTLMTSNSITIYLHKTSVLFKK